MHFRKMRSHDQEPKPLQIMVGTEFKRETFPVSLVDMNQVRVQQTLDRVAYQ
jgi:hypothetical protein